MDYTSVQFVGPRLIELRSGVLGPPGADEVLVETQVSAISAGSELLLFRGEVPYDSESESDVHSQGLSYPAGYGYSVVGRVIAAGSSTEPSWNGRRVFAFQPHASHFLSHASALLDLPEGIEASDAVFLPNAETAVSIVQDAAPILGERVLVLGQGVVGLLCTGILSEFPLDGLVTADRYSLRRKASEELGVSAALDPTRGQFGAEALSYTGNNRPGFDVVIELTGNPEALEDAIALTAFGGRVVMGSWLGTKESRLHLGGRFHRSRITLLASQVSTIAPQLSGRWDKLRRFGTAWEAIRRLGPSRWITHRFPVERAMEAYRLLDESPEDAIQVILEYS